MLCCFEQILEVTPYKTTLVQPLASHLITVLGTAGEVKTNS